MACERITFETHFGKLTKDEDNISGMIGWSSKHKHFLVDRMLRTAHQVTVAYKVDFYQLINGVGGALGLFLGFSLLSTLKIFVQYVGAKWKLE